MNNSLNTLDIAFEDVIAALLDNDAPLNPRTLYRLTDLVGEELNQLRAAWPNIIEWRRQALLEDLEQLYEEDTLLSFEAICRLALEDPSPQIRYLALRSLQEYDVIDLIPTFIQIMNEEDDEELRAIAASILGKYVYLGEVDSLSKEKQKTIEDNLFRVARGLDTPMVRRKAVESLGYSSHEDVPDLIYKAYHSGDLEWIASALYAMGRTVDSRWEPEIKKMLTHPSPEIRFEAIRAAGELELSGVRAILMNYLEESDRDIRLAAVWSLSKIGGYGLQEIFARLLEDAELEEEAQIIEEALEQLAFNESLGTLDEFDFNNDEDF